MPESPEQRIVGGIPVADALDIFRASVNQPGNMFSRDHWLMPKLERLRRLLSDPVSADQATALVDVLYQRKWMADLLEWLEEGPEIPWTDFPEWRRRRNMERRIEADEALGISWPLKFGEQKINCCPKCGSPNFIPILYGVPGPQGLEAVARREIAFGGCSVQLDGPRWCCPRCSLRWR